MDTENKSLEVTVIADKKTHTLAVKDYESTLANIKEALKSYNAPESISDDETNKAAKAERANLNKLAKAISDKRIATVEDFTGDFQDQMKNLTKLIVDKANTYKKPIDDYANSKKVVAVEPAKYTLVCTTMDESKYKKLVAFCKDNGIEAK